MHVLKVEVDFLSTELIYWHGISDFALTQHTIILSDGEIQGELVM